MSGSNPLPPGSTVGILGCGQLGRMLALAAARLGLRTHVYGDATGPAFDVVSAGTVGRFDDTAALETFARKVDVVTYEFENVPVAATEAIARIGKPVRPGPRALEVAQDRLIEKRFVTDLGLPVSPFAALDEERGTAEATAAMTHWGTSAILKSRRLGYDGKGQVLVARPTEIEAAFAALGRPDAVLERRLAFDFEVSVLVVRGLDGPIAYYDVPQNTHRGGILHRSAVPAPIPDAVNQRARDIAGTIAVALDYVGVLAVEMFYMGADAPEPLIVNEFAPRVHNSGHWTMDACAISQFENHIRAVAGWPLGSTARHSDAVMENLIGREALDWARLAADNGAALHLYGKREAREGRKMGHLNRLSPLGTLLAPGE